MEEDFPTFSHLLENQDSNNSNGSSGSGRTSTTMEYRMSIDSEGQGEMEEPPLPDLAYVDLDVPPPDVGRKSGGDDTVPDHQSLSPSSSSKRTKHQDKEAKDLEKKRKAEEKLKQKQLLDEAKEAKKLEKDREKAEKQKEKQLEKAKNQLEREKQRMVSKENAEDYLCTELDRNIGDIVVGAPSRDKGTAFDAHLEAVFQNAKIPERLTKMDGRGSGVHGMVTWSRTVLENTQLKTEVTPEVLVVMKLREFLEYMNQDLGISLRDFGETLLSDGKLRERQTEAKHLTLVTVGLEHFKTSNFDGKAKRLEFAEKLEECLVELQMETGIQFRAVDKVEDLADLIRGFHRAVALKPAKQKELGRDNYQATGAVEKGIRMDAGNRKEAAKDWWIKMLMQIPSLGRQKAEAIAEEYESPIALLCGYKELNSEKEKEELLRNIKPKGLQRVLGPVMSKTIFHIVTSTDGGALVNLSKNNTG